MRWWAHTFAERISDATSTVGETSVTLPIAFSSESPSQPKLGAQTCMPDNGGCSRPVSLPSCIRHCHGAALVTHISICIQHTTRTTQHAANVQRAEPRLQRSGAVPNEANRTVYAAVYERARADVPRRIGGAAVRAPRSAARTHPSHGSAAMQPHPRRSQRTARQGGYGRYATGVQRMAGRRRSAVSSGLSFQPP